MSDAHGDLVALRTLKLSSAVLCRVRAELEVRFADRGEGAPRVAYRVPGGIELCVTQVDNRVVTYQVDPINLSKSGLAVLHGNFLYDDTPCLARLATVDGEYFAVTGRIIRSECISAPVHLLGIQFNQEIDVGDFVAPAHPSGGERGHAPIVAPAEAESMEMELALLQNALHDLGSLIQSGAQIEEIQDHYAQVTRQFDVPQRAQAPQA